MPRNKGTSRKGKPGRLDRESGMGKALQKAQGQRYRPRENGKNRRGEGGMAMQAGVTSVGLEEEPELKTRSVLEMNNLDDFLLQADLAHREFATEKEGVVVLDSTGQAYRPPKVQWEDDERPSFVFQELSVPRRPAWDESTTPDELHRQEEAAFLDWRRAIAVREEEIARTSSSTSVTPFEKNLEVWRQLWRVLERSSCLLQLVDARNPLFYLSDDLKAYAESLGKPMMVLMNKSDYLSRDQRQMWYDYLVERGWEPIFFSAVKEQQKLDAEAQRRRREERGADPRKDEDPADLEEEEQSEEENESESDDESEMPPEEESQDDIGIDVPLTRKQLLDTMLGFAEKHGCQRDERYGDRFQFGMVGFPNVGKSSVINVLVGSSRHTHGVVRVGVASQPGKTKHFQTLYLPAETEMDDKMMLCDCPGLVFPSFVSNTADLIAAGVYPIAQMRDHWPVIRLICERIPREIINAHYGIQLPKPTQQEMIENGWTKLPPPKPDEFLGTFCIARGMLAASSGIPDYARAARYVIQDYATGKLLFCHAPPEVRGNELLSFYRETIDTALANTAKLRMKLEKQQRRQQEQTKDDSDQEEGDELENDFDDDILELLGGAPEASSQQPANKSKRPTVKKWGKKGRKLRNKDPYGCHTTIDENIAHDQVSMGVIVNAGKHGRGGYTRPTGYGSVRATASSS